MSTQEHHAAAAGLRACCAIITLSDTRTAATDRSGARMRQLLEAAGHSVAATRLIPDEAAVLDGLLQEWLGREDVDVLLTTGGTGISRRDQTIPVIRRHLTLELPGFGELFRMLSFQQVGSSAMLSRAIGGLAGEKLLFALPGSTPAVELALEKLILPELGHLLEQRRR
jgi:molybdenum cofactor biosynthesis protein B